MTSSPSLFSFIAPLFVLLFGSDSSLVIAEKIINGTCRSTSNIRCGKGMCLPVWEPTINLSPGDRAARATVYFSGLIYMFLGVSIIADRFMAAIEVITSKEKEVMVKMPNGEKTVVSVRIWNETVSNLTLMALGSSAPEIMLSVIEIVFKDFKAGELGPGTIVGSAAFNLFVIIGLCIIVIPDGQLRRIRHLLVFFITATWSVFAYLWLYIIIAVTSEGVVDVWEGVLTFAFFPLTVITAYIADTKIFLRRFLPKRVTGVRRYTNANADVDIELQTGNHVDSDNVIFKGLNHDNEEVREFERHRKEYIEIIREVRKKHPNTDAKQLEEMAQLEVLNRGPKSRAFYRMQATRQLTGSGNVIKKSKVERRMSTDERVEDEIDDGIQRIFFDPGHYTVMENVGTFHLTVSRKGGDLTRTVYVNYKTEDGTANAGEDYEAAEGTLVFYSGEQHKQLPITILDDDIFEEDEHFYVQLSELRYLNADGVQQPADYDIQLTNPSMATIMVLDDDHAGIFHFEDKVVDVSESCGEANVKVMRSSGARGFVKVPYQTIEGTAKGQGVDFEDADGYLEFENDETEKYVRVRIMDDEEYEKNEFFYIQLGEPILLKRPGEDNDDDDSDGQSEKDPKSTELEEMGKPRLGELVKVEVHITESMDFKNTVDKLLKKANLSLVVGTSSWKEQFIEAITVSADPPGRGDGDDGGEDDEEEERLPSCMDYVMHFLTIFWKVLFAFVPPTDYAGGWLCFTICIIMIGLLTMIIGDLASHFGCTIGLTDAVTAITFVALGTSLPDTFASKVAAIGDECADSSVGNVTGSNAVNVFLGIGLAWSIAAIYHTSKGEKFRVKAGSLGFSVTIFCIFAMIAIAVLVSRRRKSIGGELGGPRTQKYISGCFLIFLWIMYVVLSALENYCHIPGF